MILYNTSSLQNWRLMRQQIAPGGPSYLHLYGSPSNESNDGLSRSAGAEGIWMQSQHEWASGTKPRNGRVQGGQRQQEL